MCGGGQKERDGKGMNQPYQWGLITHESSCFTLLTHHILFSGFVCRHGPLDGNVRFWGASGERWLVNNGKDKSHWVRQSWGSGRQTWFWFWEFLPHIESNNWIFVRKSLSGCWHYFKDLPLISTTVTSDYFTRQTWGQMWVIIIVAHQVFIFGKTLPRNEYS